MEEEEEDVDVIFEDSVLHQVLKDCGFTSLETESRAKMEGDGCQSYKPNEEEENENTMASNEHLGYSILARLVYPSDFLIQVYHYHRHQTLQRLVSSRILSADDRHFLQDFVEESSPAISPPENFTIWTKKFIGFLLLVTVMLNVSPAIMYISPVMVLNLEAYAASVLSPAYHNYLCIAIINFVWCCLILCLSRLLRGQLRRELFELAQSWGIPLCELESEAWELFHLERKCLRLLRESELVARGFILASQKHAYSPQSEGQRSSVDKLCPQLRLTMLTQNKELLAKIKLAVTTMMKSIAMRVSDLDFNTMEDPLELISLASAENNNEDVIAMAPISKTVSLLQIYISGCMRRLALCFYQRNLRDSTLNPFIATLECVQTCTDAIACARSVLQEHHSFYRAVQRSISPRNMTHSASVQRSAEDQSSEKDSSSDKLQHFYVCVNSLDLHLQSVLLMTRELSSVLETRLDQSNQSESSALETVQLQVPVPLTTEDWSSWEGTMKRVKSTLDSVQCCYEECMKYLGHEDKSIGSQASSVPKDTSIPSNWRETEQTPVKVIPAEDPVIVDQVFEAETEAAGDSEEEDMAEWRRQRQEAAQTRAKMQEQRETMKRLRQELGAVVGHRAILQREREERALARARGEVVGENGNEGNAGDAPQLKQTQIMNGEILNGGTDEEKDAADLEERNRIEDGVDQNGKQGGKWKKFPQVEVHAQNYVDDEAKTGASESECGAFKWPYSDTQLDKNKQAEVVVNGRALHKTNEQKKNQKGVLATKNIVWKKVYAEVHQPSHKGLKVQQNNGLNNPEKEEKFTFQKHEDCLAETSILEKVRLGLVADPSACSEMIQTKDSEIVPGLPYSALRVCSGELRKSLSVGHGESANEAENVVSKCSKGPKASEDVMSDSSTVVKHFWQRPAPPRVHKIKGPLYVTPVNLITVGYVLQGGDEGKKKDDDGGDDGDDAEGGSGAGGSNDGEPVGGDVEVNAVTSNDDADVRVKSGGGGGGEEAGACGGEEAGACGGNDPAAQKAIVHESGERRRKGGARPRSKTCFLSESDGKGKARSGSDPGAVMTRAKHLTNKKRRGRLSERHAVLMKADIKNLKMIQQHMFAGQQQFLNERVEEVLRQRRRQRFLSDRDKINNPFMSPNTEESDDGGPDPDLVGGFRFSPEDLSSETRPARSPSMENLVQLEAERTGSLWLRKLRKRPGGASGPVKSLAVGGLPLREVGQAEDAHQWQGHFTSRSNTASRRQVSRTSIATARRRFNSEEILTEQAHSIWPNYRHTAPNLQGTNTDEIRPLPDSHPSSSIAAGAHSQQNSSQPEKDPWVKITQHKVKTKDSEIEVIRQKDIDLQSILVRDKTPPPSPKHDSSFTQELAKMAAAQAQRTKRSDNLNILGAEETFGDNSSGDEGL
ncbi:vezatin-like [Elysia marginata]|uniref:Vezatin-like n=1 Tax=Elysia marginata TaxID=1093978 RepID=A0AAV4H7R6_9GAST|nr:vezatin-like [Elysia marginata]